MCAGVQNVSRPIVRCHEISHRMPTTIEVAAKMTMRLIHEIEFVRAAATGRAISDATRVGMTFRSGIVGQKNGGAKSRIANSAGNKLPEIATTHYEIRDRDMYYLGAPLAFSNISSPSCEVALM